MSDFTSPFWNWFISVPVVVGIIFCFWLVIKYSGETRPSPDQEADSTGHIWDEDLAELNNPLPHWWKNMFYITLVFGIVYLALYPGLGSFKGFLGWTQISQYENEVDKAEKTYGPIYDQYLSTSIEDLQNNQDALTIGKRLYSTYCTVCHGSDAKGARGFPNLRDNDWLYGGSPDQIKQSILNGRQGMMPAWKELLSDDQIKSVVAYVRGLHDGSSAGNTEGLTVFNTNCAMCHGPDAKGMAPLGAPNLADETWLYGGSEKRVTESVVNGRQGKMPAHKEFLGEAKAHILSAYIYSLSK